MSSVINTNIASLNAQRNLSTSQNSLATALQRLSSGLRINSAKDDAAGLAISDRMTSQINGLNQAARNANDGVSLAQTAEGGLSSMTDNLQRIRQLAVQSANSTNSGSDRAALNSEVAQLVSEIDRVATTTQFNGLNLLDGSFTSQQFQVGANANQTISFSVTGARSSQIGSYVNSTGTVAQTSAAGGTGAGVANGTGGGGLATLTAYTGVNGTASNGSNISLASGTNSAVNVLDSSLYVGTATEQGNKSAYAITAAINASSISGISATAVNSQTYAAAAGGAASTSDFVKWTAAGTTTVVAGSYTLSINGQQVISQALNATAGNISIDTAVSNINTYQATTGVVASKTTGGSLKLTSTDGRDIRVTEAANLGTGTGSVQGLVSVFSNAIAQTAVGVAATQTLDYVQRGQVTLASNASVSIGGTAGIVGQSSTLLAAAGSVATLDVSSIVNANLAIQSVDSALAAISSNRASLGAIQNRFGSAVTNLQSSSENISAARSRIQDTDFAAETAALTRGQILQQAGTAMLAQANALPNTVMALLK